eukprot:7376982-Prymnesium_polylepis.2
MELVRDGRRVAAHADRLARRREVLVELVRRQPVGEVLVQRVEQPRVARLDLEEDAPRRPIFGAAQAVDELAGGEADGALGVPHRAAAVLVGLEALRGIFRGRLRRLPLGDEDVADVGRLPPLIPLRTPLLAFPPE